MEFEIEKSDFLRSIQKVQAVVERKNALPLLSNVRIVTTENQIEINATDLEVGIRDRIDVNESEGGSITVSAKKLYEVLKELPEEKIRFKVEENNWISISCGLSNFKLVGMSDEDYPRLADFDDTGFVPVGSEVMDILTRKSSFAVSHDENRRVLNGTLFHVSKETLRMVATDGHRLAYVESQNITDLPEMEIIIPQKGIREIQRMISSGMEEMKFGIMENQVVFRVGNETVLTRLVDGKFPDYTKVVPKNAENEIKIDKDGLYNSLRRVSLFSDLKVRGVKFDVSAGGIQISASTPEYGEAKDRLDIQYDGEPFSIGFNVNYLLDLLRSIDSELVVMRIGDMSGPVVFEPSEPSEYKYFSVVMPMII
ncbi:DNA polymerase III subunit beta [bacterium]|nr:DNA polymerase III subunit beta [candidate division CSSED10-310 bacterium]